MDKKLIIFDVDGTLTETKSGATFRKTADDWQWLPGRLEVLRKLDSLGVKLACATNQGGVAFGYLDLHDVRGQLFRMAQEAHIAQIEMCFSHPKASIEDFRQESPRRKPAPGMLLEIIEASGERPEDCLMVGDREEDEQAAKNAGIDFVHADAFFSAEKEVQPPQE